MDLTNSNLASITIDSDDNKFNDAVFQKQSLKSYAARVFQESTIGILSSIFTTHSKYRRFFKIFFSSLCITGFIYHCITFLNHVFQYPEVVDISLDRSDTYDWPAYTYCNNNPIRKDLFCALHPQHCVKPSEEFCKKFPSYCGARPKLIPKEDYYYTLPDDFQFEVMLRPRNVPNILMGSHSYLARRKGKKEENEISGPYLRTSDFPHNSKSCYSIHSVVESNQKPLQKRRGNSTFGITDDIMRFRVDEAQMMDPRIEPGVYFSVHSPYEAANPLKKGIFLKSGRTYKLYVEMEKEILLKAPFESNCVDYEELWEKNNRTGPRTKKMCREKCFVDYRKLRHECVYSTILYPHKERICSKRIDGEATPRPVLEEETKFYEKCLENCLDECRSYKYTTEFTMQYYISYVKEDIRHNYVDVTIHLSNEEVKVLKHSPKYETVDVFSSVGGFMGCWLGIALMDILDVFGSIVTVFRYAFRKR